MRVAQQRALPSGVAVRRARPGDASAVLALALELGYKPEERGFDETFAMVVRHPEAVVFVAAQGARVVGYLALSHRPQIRLGGRLAVIDELVVTRDQRAAGIGSALLDAALDHARSIGCCRVEVSSRRTRESYTRGFYARRGFIEIDAALFRIELKRR